MCSPWTEAGLALALVVALGPTRADAQACHAGTVEAASIAWRTTLEDGARLALPLPDDVTVEAIEGGEGVYEDGRLVGVVGPSAGATEIVIVARQPVEGSDVTLHPPLVGAPQRIVLGTRAGERADFVPRLGGPLQRHVGHHASSGIDERARDALDRQCGRSRALATYVEDVGYEDLRGELIRGADRRSPVLWLGALLLLLGVIGGTIAYRRWGARAELEHAEAVIEGRFRGLEERSR